MARTLPAARYEPFVQALFANQDRWAFGRDIDPKAELWKTAALAGMNRATFDAAYDNAALKEWIVAQQNAAQTKYKIDSTPSFVINGRKISRCRWLQGICRRGRCRHLIGDKFARPLLPPTHRRLQELC